MKSSCKKTLLDTLPKNLEGFMEWEQTDGFTNEWNNGEIIRFSYIHKTQPFILEFLTTFLI
jgi:hypothetical protein